jgi:hypothetical protein
MVERGRRNSSRSSSPCSSSNSSFGTSSRDESVIINLLSSVQSFVYGHLIESINNERFNTISIKPGFMDSSIPCPGVSSHAPVYLLDSNLKVVGTFYGIHYTTDSKGTSTYISFNGNVSIEVPVDSSLSPSEFKLLSSNFHKDFISR